MRTKTSRNVALTGALAIGVLTGAPAQAGTGLCVVDASFGQAWEINIISCSGADCILELDRTVFPTIPIPATGGLSVNGTVWGINWNGAFSGATHGTLHHACQIDVANGLPASGSGMMQRIADFSSPGPVEFFTGTCTLRLCNAAVASAATDDGVDPATQQ
ncbi:MAG: hypothetical protein H6983_02705 [Ectothiorhodospiraceae bacterium]|nr:hypothetical protein [Ectothiorhodospiraceae bacterium]